jgi:hypothetical protein
VRRARRLCQSLLQNGGTEVNTVGSQGVLGTLAAKQPALCKHWLAALAAVVRRAYDDDEPGSGGGGGGRGGETNEPPLRARVCT